MSERTLVFRKYTRTILPTRNDPVGTTRFVLPTGPFPVVPLLLLRLPTSRPSEPFQQTKGQRSRHVTSDTTTLQSRHRRPDLHVYVFWSWEGTKKRHGTRVTSRNLDEPTKEGLKSSTTGSCDVCLGVHESPRVNRDTTCPGRRRVSKVKK